MASRLRRHSTMIMLFFVCFALCLPASNANETCSTLSSAEEAARRADELLKQNDFSRALECYARAQSLSQTVTPSLYYGTGLAANFAQRDTIAIAQLLLSLLPKSSRTASRLSVSAPKGSVATCEGRRDVCEEAMREACYLQKQGATGEMATAATFFYLGNAGLRKNFDPKVLRECFLRGLEKDGQSSDLLFSLALVSEAEGNQQRAIVEAKRALEAKKDHRQSHILIGNLLRAAENGSADGKSDKCEALILAIGHYNAACLSLPTPSLECKHNLGIAFSELSEMPSCAMRRFRHKRDLLKRRAFPARKTTGQTADGLDVTLPFAATFVQRVLDGYRKQKGFEGKVRRPSSVVAAVFSSWYGSEDSSPRQEKELSDELREIAKNYLLDAHLINRNHPAPLLELSSLLSKEGDYSCALGSVDHGLRRAFVDVLAGAPKANKQRSSNNEDNSRPVTDIQTIEEFDNERLSLWELRALDNAMRRSKGLRSRIQKSAKLLYNSATARLDAFSPVETAAARLLSNLCLGGFGLSTSSPPEALAGSEESLNCALSLSRGLVASDGEGQPRREKERAEGNRLLRGLSRLRKGAVSLRAAIVEGDALFLSKRFTESAEAFLEGLRVWEAVEREKKTAGQPSRVPLQNDQVVRALCHLDLSWKYSGALSAPFAYGGGGEEEVTDGDSAPSTSLPKSVAKALGGADRVGRLGLAGAVLSSLCPSQDRLCDEAILRQCLHPSHSLTLSEEVPEWLRKRVISSYAKSKIHSHVSLSGDPEVIGGKGRGGEGERDRIPREGAVSMAAVEDCVCRSERNGAAAVRGLQCAVYRDRESDVASVRSLPLSLLPSSRFEVLSDPATAGGSVRTSIVRVGFLSSGFEDDPVGKMFVSTLAGLDRLRFEVFCFALTGKKSLQEVRRDEYRHDIVLSCSSFVDLRNKSERQTKQVINAATLDVLIDVDGYLPGGANYLLAPRSAPVQCSMIGFAATTGNPFVDYVSGDAVVLPPEYSRESPNTALFSEAFLLLHHSFYLNDLARVQPKALQRSPPSPNGIASQKKGEGFLFCAFHQNFKLSRDIVAAWGRILSGCPLSKLWMIEPRGRAEEEIRTTLLSEGIEEEQLIFTGKLPFEEHILEKRACDLFLDTPVFSAHTTALDMLLSGTPLLTLPGSGLASRISTALSSTVSDVLLAYRNIDEYVAAGESLCAEHRGRREASVVAEAAREIQDKLLQRKSVFRSDERLLDFEASLRLALEAQAERRREEREGAAAAYAPEGAKKKPFHIVQKRRS